MTIISYLAWWFIIFSKPIVCSWCPHDCKSYNIAMMHKWLDIWSPKNTIISFSAILVALTSSFCWGVCLQILYMLSIKESSTPIIWLTTTTSNSWKSSLLISQFQNVWMQFSRWSIDLPKWHISCHVQSQQDDWVVYLHLAEFSYKKLIHSSTWYFPFVANIGCHPRWTMNLHLEVPTNPAAEDRLSRLQEIHATILHNFYNPQITHKRIADRHRLDSTKTCLASTEQHEHH